MLLLEFLTDSNGPVTLRQICDQFALKSGGEGDALAGRLERMRSQGLVLQDRKGRYALPQKMDIVPGRVSGHANGYGFVIPDDGSEDLFLHHRQMRKVLHGDRVLARLKRIDERGRKEGVVVEVLVEPKREIVGHFHVESGIGFVEPDDPRHARDITIPDDCRNGAEAGDIVVARIIRHPIEHRHAVGEIVEVIGKQLEAGMETEIAIRKHAIPDSWPAEVHDQLKQMAGELQAVTFEKDRHEKDRPIKDRSDIRNLPLVTIDGEDAKDFDDAVYCEPAGNGWRLLVAIADVSHYVRAGTALDREALKRGNSVYFPNRVVPMLPQELSNGICSLNPEQDRYCMVCDISLSARGEIDQYRFYPAVMHSKARLTYAIVDQIVTHRDAAMCKRWEQVTPHLDNLHALSRLLLARRRERGTIEFEFPEAHIQFDQNQKISQISIRQRNQAHRLIEECMLAANLCAARYLQKNLGSRAIYRNHQGPTNESLVELRRFLSGIGLKIEGGEEPKAADYARLVEAVSAKQDIAPVVQMLLLRSLSQAVYGTEPNGHFALAYPVYTHFTSPIRRYGDLVVHRQINQLIDAEKGSPPAPASGLEKIAERCSFTERRAEDASRDVTAWLKAEFMQDKVGEQFDGVISGVKEFGVFVQLNDIFIDGLVHVTALGDDYYHFDPLHFQLIGERSGRRFRLGDRVRISVVRVSLDDAKIDFELCGNTGGQQKSKAGKSKPGKSRPEKSKPGKSRPEKSKPGKSKPGGGKGKNRKRTKARHRGGKSGQSSRH